MMVEVVDKREVTSKHYAHSGDFIRIGRNYFTIMRIEYGEDDFVKYNAIKIGDEFRTLAINNFDTIDEIIDFVFGNWPDTEYIPSGSVKITVTIENA